MKSLKGKVALITGASKGIGRAIARRLGEEGADTVVGASGLDLWETLRKELEATGVQCLAERCDTERVDRETHLARKVSVKTSSLSSVSVRHL